MVFRRVAVDDDQVRGLAGLDAAGLRVDLEQPGAIGGRDLDGLERSQAGLDEQFDGAPVAIAGDATAVAGRVGAGDQQAAGAEEFRLELEISLAKAAFIDGRVVLDYWMADQRVR